MTAPKLTNGFKANFIYRLKSNRKFAIISLILNLLSAPLFVIAYMVYCNQTIEKSKILEHSTRQVSSFDFPSFNYLYIFIPILATAIAVMLILFIAFNSFNYLYKKSSVDMFMSLPLTTRQRFFSDFLAGAVSFIGPFLTSGLITMILSFIAQPVSNKAFKNSLEELNFLRGNIPLTMFKFILFGSIIMLSLYVITVLIISLCGNLFEGILYTVLINASIPLSIIIGGNLIFGDLYGIDSTYSIRTILYRTSPAGAVISLIDYFRADSYASKYVVYTYWMIPYLIFTSILFGLTYFVYRKRKAEHVGKPVVFKVFYHAILNIIIFIISCVLIGGSADDDYKQVLIPLIIVTAIFFFIFEVAINRGFKKLWQGGIRYAVTISSIIAIIIIANKTEGFGSVYKVPEINDVSSVTTNYTGIHGYGLASSNNDKITFKDKKVIQLFIDFHNQLLQSHKNDLLVKPYYEENDNYSYIVIYNMKDGSKIIRKYDIDYETYLQLDIINTSDEYANKIVSLYKNYDASHGKKIEITLTKKIDGKYKHNENIYYFKDKAQLKGFLEAYTKDLKIMSPEKFSEPFKDNPTEIYVENLIDIFFDSSSDYPNTVKYLDEMGISLSDENLSL